MPNAVSSDRESGTHDCPVAAICDRQISPVLCAICAFLTCLLSWGSAAAEDSDEESNKLEVNPSGEPPGGDAPLDFKFYPVGGWTPVTGFALGGVSSFKFDLPGEAGRQSSVNLAGVYTQKDQLAAQLSWELAFDRERWIFHGKAKGKIWPDDYYGVGIDAASEGEEIDSAYLKSTTGVQYRLFDAPNLYVGLLHQLQAFDIDAPYDGELMEEAPPGYAGGRASGAGLQLVIDERDSEDTPRRGYYAETRLLRFDSLLGSHFDFWHFELDGRRYFDLGKDHSIGLRGLFKIQSGEAPFFAMPTLGGSKRNRGITKGRFLHETLLSGQAEYRSPIFWRISFSTFAGLGTVAPGFHKLDNLEPKWNAGAGLRVYVDDERESSIRLDVGFSEEHVGVYFSTGEAF